MKWDILFLRSINSTVGSYDMISILMATYNGEKYLVEQIESIFAQTFDDFKLHINDDF